VLLIQLSCTMSSGFELIEQRIPRALGYSLTGGESKFVSASLHVTPIDVRGLILDV
jgi:hypothetical protein